MDIEALPYLEMKDFSHIEPSNINVWKPEYESIMVSWRKLAAINMWLAMASKYLYEQINNWLTYPSIIISVFMSIGIISINNCSDKISHETYILASLNLVSAILTTLNKHLSAAEKSHEFYVRSKEYYAIIREIDYVLSLNVKDRPDAYETIVRMRANLEKVVDSQMDFPLRIIRKYEEKFKPLESSIFQDLEAEKIQKQKSNEKDGEDISSQDIESTKIQTIPSPVYPNPFKSLASIKYSQPSVSCYHEKRVDTSLIMMPYQLYSSIDIVSPLKASFSESNRNKNSPALKNDDVESTE